MSVRRIGIVIMPAALLLAIGHGNANQKNCERQLEQAKGYINTDRSSEAILILDAMDGCPVPIKIEAEKLRNQAKLKIKCSNLWSALNLAMTHAEKCSVIAEYEKNDCGRYRSIADAKASNGPCIPPEVERQANDLVRALEDGNIKEARRRAQELRNSYPSHPKLNEWSSAIDELDKEQSAIKKKPKSSHGSGDEIVSRKPPEILPDKTDPSSRMLQRNPENWENTGRISAPSDAFNAFYSEAKRQFDAGDYYGARESAKLALTYKPGEDRAKQTMELARTNIEYEISVLRNALGAYYSGRYDETENLLEGLVNSGRASSQAYSLSEFYLGAAAASKSRLSAGNTNKLIERALRHFRNSLDRQPGFVPPQEKVSREVLQLFSAAQSLPQGK